MRRRERAVEAGGVPAVLIDRGASVWHDPTVHVAYMQARGWSIPSADRLGGTGSPENRRRRAVAGWAVEHGLHRDGQPDWPALKARNLL